MANNFDDYSRMGSQHDEPSQVLAWDGPTAHGVRAAFYSNLPGPGQTAILECLCGEEITGQTSSWEDAGREMDEHLKTVGPQTKETT